MNLSVLFAPAIHVLAQATQTATGPAAAGAAATQPTSRAPDWLNALSGNMLFPLMLGMAALYIIAMRSKKSQERQRTDMLGQMKRGDRVQTIGGVLGKVVEVEDSKVLLKVDETSNTKIWFSRNSIHRVITEEKAEAAK